MASTADIGSKPATDPLPGISAPLDPPSQHAQYSDEELPPTYLDSSQQAVNPRLRPTMGERFHKLSSAAGRPVNMASHVVGAEGWWPSTLEKECVKAARILYSFTGLETDAPPRKGGPIHPTGLTRKSMVKIPPKVLQECAGLAIFNTFRVGAWHGSLSGGSGVVIARRPDGTWSPPSAFLISTLGAGFMFGLDVYDCVCVLNSPSQVAAFTHPRLSLGGNAGITIGPVGAGGALNSTVSSAPRPMWSYMKSRGLWAGIQVDGTVIVSRGDANAVFYGERGITVRRILTEDVAWPMGARPLFEVLKAIDGRTDYNRTIVQDIGGAPPPGDLPAVGEVGVVDEKNPSRPPSFVEVEHPRENENRQEKEDDLYSTSAVDEKERLAKSGY